LSKLLKFPIPNGILAALPRKEYERILPMLQHDDWPSGKQLYEAGELVSHVYFITAGMASLVSVSGEKGTTIEVGVIGSEGMLGVSASLGANRAPQGAIVQLPGSAQKMSMKAFRDELKRPGQLQSLLLRHMYLFHFQVTRSLVCNRFHPVGARLARWVLMCRDRMNSNEIPLTHEFLSQMLGTARQVVSLAVGQSQTAGLIRSKRGHITILNLAGLKSASCDCYDLMNKEQAQFSD